jgi:PAS domain S-box-containing protein
LQQFAKALDVTAIVPKTDIYGNIIYVNDKFCELSGYTKDELIGKPHNIVRHPEMDKQIFKELWATIKDKKVYKNTIRNLAKDGSEYIVDSIIIPIIGSDGKIKEYLSVRYFVTELVQKRDEAITAERVKDEFLSNMSHELRSPLNAIKGFSTLLQPRLKDETNAKYLKHISESSDTLMGLINDILDLSKIKSGKFNLDNHDFIPLKNISLFLERFDSQLIQAELNIDIILDKSLKTTLNGDWLRISQIITNLLSNAIKFTTKGKKISFKATYENSQLVIEVIDEGIGMSKEAQNKIFNPYEQAKSSITRDYGGTGLGLSIVLNLVEQMQGDIKLVSKEGEGSSFKIMLPLNSTEQLDNIKYEDKQETKEKLLKGHILVAEDDKTNQILVGAMLKKIGLSYAMADDGAKAVEMFGEAKYDVVMLDENMPNLNGSQAMKQIHEKYGNTIPVVALTADAMSGVKEKYLESGMSGYLSKPIYADELYAVLEPLLKNKND